MARKAKLVYADAWGTISDLIEELVVQEQDGVLDYLDRNLTERGENGFSGRKVFLHTVIAMAGEHVSMRPLIGVLTERNPTSIPLASFRGGGISYLLDLLEEAEISVDTRVSCAYYLGMRAGPEVLPRMKRLRQDQTPYTRLQGNPFEQETLGHNVIDAIERIEGRERYRAAHSGESDDDGR